MPSLFENAIASIRMGVEDFRQQDHARDISAVRNFYAGVLLLAKEALVRSVPDADPEIIISAKLKPVPDGNGDIKMQKVGHMTVDFRQIAERAKDFGIALDDKALNELNKIRNDLEHHYTSESATAIRAAISKGFPVAASLFRQLGEEPQLLMGDAWTTMLETKELYDQELKEARATLAKVDWYSAWVASAAFKCDSCQSELVEQIDAENEQQSRVQLRCRTCGAEPDLSEAIERLIDGLYGIDAYIRYKDGGEDGPIYQCPACDMATLIENDYGSADCANCNEPLDFESECNRCGAGIRIQDYLDGLDEGLCSYCNYMRDKVMRDD